MKDDITDETIDPAMQKSVTDWLAKVISGNKPAGPNVNGHEQEKTGQGKSAEPEIAARPEAVSTLEPAAAPKTAKRETAAKRGSAAKPEFAAADAPTSAPAAEAVLGNPGVLQVEPPVVEAAAPAEIKAPQSPAPVGEVIASEASASATAVAEASPENAATTVEPEVNEAAEAVSEPPVVDVVRDGLPPLEPPIAEVAAASILPEREISVRDILRDSELVAEEPEVAEPAVEEPAAGEPVVIEAEASLAAVSDEPQIETEPVELGPVEPEAVEAEQPVEAEAAESEAVEAEQPVEEPAAGEPVVIEAEQPVEAEAAEPETVEAEAGEPVLIDAAESVAAVGVSPEPEAEVESAEPVFEPVWSEPVAAEPEVVEVGENVAAFDLSGEGGEPRTEPKSVELEPAAAAENVFARKGFLWGPERRKPREMGEATYQGPERRRSMPKELKEISEKPESWDAAWTTLMRLGTALPSLARAMESRAEGEPETGLSHDVQREVADMRLSQFELRTAVQDHSQHLKRVEDQLTRLRESLGSDSPGNADLEDTVKSTVKLVRVVGISVGALLAVLILMVAILMAHGSR